MAAEEQAAQDDDEIRVLTQSIAPPIDVEMSGDSGDEDESPPNGLFRRHSHIPKDEEETASLHSPPEPASTSSNILQNMGPPAVTDGCINEGFILLLGKLSH